MTKLAKAGQWSKAQLMNRIDTMKGTLKDKSQMGGLGHAAVGHTAAMVARHAMASAFGDAAKASMAQKVLVTVAAVATGAFRIGMSTAKASAGNTAAAASAEGLCAALTERALELWSGLPSNT